MVFFGRWGSSHSLNWRVGLEAFKTISFLFQESKATIYKLQGRVDELLRKLQELNEEKLVSTHVLFVLIHTDFLKLTSQNWCARERTGDILVLVFSTSF